MFERSNGGGRLSLDDDRFRGPDGRCREGGEDGGLICAAGLSELGAGGSFLVREFCSIASERGQPPSGGGDGGKLDCGNACVGGARKGSVTKDDCMTCGYKAGAV